MGVEWVGRIVPLRAGPNPVLISLMEAASRSALEVENLTPLGETMIKVLPSSRPWIRQIWEDSGEDPDTLPEQVLVLAFQCVHNGGPN